MVICTISEKVVFVKWNITTNDEANQNNFINEWRGEAESWVYEIILICQVMSCDISFHKNHFFRNFISKIIVYDGLCNKFWEMILRNDFEKWYIMALVPWYIISQNHFSKFGCLCFVYIHLQWWAGPYTLEQPTQPQCWVLLSQPAPIHREYEKNISRKLIYILLILKWFFLKGFWKKPLWLVYWWSYKIWAH